MAYENIVTVDISLQTAGVLRETFGVPLFIGDHVWFTEKTRSYTKLEDAAGEFPTDSNEYKALVQGFSADLAPSLIKIGRREVDLFTVTPQAATSAGQVYAITATGTSGGSTTAEFTTATGSETPAEIATALVAGLGSIAGITITDTTGAFTMAKSGTEPFSVQDLSRVSYETTTSQSAADTMVAITEADDEFYFVACSDHTDAFVMALAPDIEARTKMYFVGLADATNYGVYSESATDTASKLAQGAYLRTSAWYHQDADTAFTEMNYVGMFAPRQAGKYVIANNKVSGQSVARNADGNVLTSTQKSNLEAKFANYTESVGGITITRNGKVSGNEWVDVIRNRDVITARATEAYQNFLINSAVVSYTDFDITALENVLSSVLGRFESAAGSPNILENGLPFVINFPKRADVPFGDIVARDFNGSFIAYLAGSIQNLKVQGNLTYNAQA